MDYAETYWNQTVDDCIYQLGLARSVCESIMGELLMLFEKVASIRPRVDDFQDYDRADVEIYANAFRDATSSAIGKLIRELKYAADMTDDIDLVIQGRVR